jgi:hypothetical protein
MKLLSASTTDNTTTSWQVSDYFQAHLGYRPFTLIVSGTMGGATVTIQISNDNNTWATAYTTTAAIAILFESTARYVRAVQSGSSGSTSITVELT